MQSAFSMGSILPAQPRRTGWSAAILAGLALLAGSKAHAQIAPQTPTSTTVAVAAAGEKADAAAFEVRVRPQTSGPVTLVERQSDGSARQLGSAILDANGAARIVTAGLAPGDHRVFAVYNGDRTHAGSYSAESSAHTEQSTVPDFTLNVAPTSLNLPAGTSGTVRITLTPLNGFTGYVTLSCSGLPLSTTCTFTPENVYVGAQGGSSDMVLATSGPAGTARLQSAGKAIVYAVLLPGLLGLAGLGAGRRRAIRMMCLTGAILVLCGGLSSCSQRFDYFYYPPQANPGTPVGQSTIAIQAIAVNGSEVTQHSTSIALTVTASTTK